MAADDPQDAASEPEAEKAPAPAANPPAPPIDPARAAEERRQAMEAERAQRQRLPWTIGIVVFCGLFFFGNAAWELVFINQQVIRPARVDVASALHAPETANSSEVDVIASTRLRVLTLLESSSIERRYQQANALLLFSILTRYLGFLTGMVLALVGAGFILGKFREQETKVSAETAAGKWGLSSTSPGIVLAILGTILMVTTIVHEFHINVADSPLYLPESASSQVTVGAPEGDSVRVAREKTLEDATLQKIESSGR